MNLNQARFNMIEQQVRPWNVLDPKVLATLEAVPRHLFVPQSLQALAYADMELPIGFGECMLNPKLDARLLQELALQPTDVVLEVGTGSGYLSALLAAHSRKVVSLERIPDLAQRAQAHLAKAGVQNAVVHVRDAALAQSVEGRFDAIVLGGSVSEIPQHLLQALQVGGRLVAIVGEEPVMRAHVVRRNAANEWHTTAPWDAAAPRLKDFPQPSAFEF